jgi:S-DNA-T family DNA segregation ATPase FtsK/SpoIIIE
MAKDKKTKSKARKRFRLFAGISEERKSTLIKYAGWALTAFTLYTLVSVGSYLFTWKADQSLLTSPDMMDQAVEVQNWGGKLGYDLSHFLVSECFGLASTVLVFLLGFLSYRMIFWKKSLGTFRIVCLSVSVTFILSLILSYASSLFSDDVVFGGGLGGDAGAAVIAWMKNLIGNIPVLFILLLLVVAWLIITSSRFEKWFAAIKETVEEPEADEEPALEEEEAEVLQDDDTDVIVGEVEPEEIDSEVDELDLEPELDPEQVLIPEEEPQKPENMEVIVGKELSTEVTEELPWIDVRGELERYEFPSLDLLEDYADGKHEVSKEELEMNNNRIRTTLFNYKIKIDKVSAIVGPTVTLYKVVPAPGVKISAIEGLYKEIGMALGSKDVRVVTLADSVGIEVPNIKRSIVPLKATLNDAAFRNSKAELPIALGYTITQKVKTFDLADAPHLLVAGSTKQGKSVALNVIISSLLYAKHPSELKFVFIDPKMVEFTAYNALLKHYLAVLPMAISEEDERANAIIKTPEKAEQVLSSLCIEMDERYKLLAAAGVNEVKSYNNKYKERHLLPTEGHKHLPYLVVVIDEYADLTMTGGSSGDARKVANNISNAIVRLAQKGRAAGIHVIIATQRPSVNVITGLIKTNFPTRIAFRVVSRVDSQTILDAKGAESLTGKGDMLYYAGVDTERVQCSLVSMTEINKITSFIGDQTGYKQCYTTPYYLPVPESQEGEPGGGTIDMQNLDSMFEEAARMIVTSQRGSTSDLQRRLGMGYARAGRVMDQLEAAGIVGPQEGSKPRQVLVSTFNELEEILSAFIK